MLIRQLYRNVSSETGLSNKCVRQLTHVLFDEIAKALSDGEEVKIYGWGRFKTQTRKAHAGRSYGKVTQNNAIRMVKFIATPKLKRYLQCGGSEPYLLRHEPIPEPFHLDP